VRRGAPGVQGSSRRRPRGGAGLVPRADRARRAACAAFPPSPVALSGHPDRGSRRRFPAGGWAFGHRAERVGAPDAQRSVGTAAGAAGDATMTIAWESAGGSDVGRLRKGNEDTLRMDPERGIFLVADGMGGHAAGEVASEIAASTAEGILGDAL